MADLSQLSGVFSGVGSVVNDLFKSEGDKAEANSYAQAADIAKQNEQITQESTAIQEAQASRSIYSTISGQRADVAGNGLQESGSAIDLLKSSAQQGALAKSEIQVQGKIQENSFAAQAGAYQGMQSAANLAAKADQGGGFLSTLGTVASVAAMFL